MIDTHAHLEACGEPVRELVARAREAGVGRIVTVGSDPASCLAVLSTAEAEPGVFAALGLHPHSADRVGEPELATLKRLLAHEKAVAVGETGLDFYRDYAQPASQLELFRAQRELAERLHKPLVIHCRAAEHELLAELERFRGEVVIHCFSSPSLLETALDRGYYLSFAGNITYPNAGDLRDAAAQVPSDRILAETDAPYLAPQPVRGRRNEPAYVVHTLDTLAHVRREEVSTLGRTIEENARRVFRLR